MKSEYCLLILLILNGCINSDQSDIPDHLQDIENLTIFSEDSEPSHLINLVQEQYFGDTDTLFFQRMIDVTIDDENRVYIINYGTHQRGIHVFNPNGSYLASVGREGDGPGEFQTPTNLQVVSNRLYFYDALLRRINVFSVPAFNLEYAFVPEIDEADSIDILAGSSIEEMIVTNDGKFLLGFRSIGDFNRDNTQVIRYNNYFLFLDNVGQILSDIILELPGESVLNYRDGNFQGWYTLPYKGRSLVAVNGKNNIYTARTQDFMIQRYDLDGKYLSAFYYDYSKHIFDVESHLANTYNNQERRTIVKDNVDFPDVWPVLESMVVDDENHLWIATNMDDKETYQWMVLESTGELIAKFQWPRDKHIKEIKNGFLYSHETDENTGLQTVVKYRIELEKL